MVLTSDTKAAATQALAVMPSTLGRVALEVGEAGGVRERMQLLLQYARDLPRLSASERTMANRVMGCTAQVLALAASYSCLVGWFDLVLVTVRGA